MVTLPYQTTIGRLYKPDEYTRGIKKAMVELPLSPVATAAGSVIRNTYYVTPREEHEDVPNFKEFINLGTDDKPELVIDSRQYMRYDDKTGATRLYAANDWQLQCIRLALTLQLINKDEGLASFARFTDLPCQVFTDWVSGTLVSRYSLRPESEMIVRVIACLYYQAMINPELRVPGEDRLAFAPIIARLTYVPLNIVMDLLDEDVEGSIGKLENANDLAIQVSSKSRALSMGSLKFADLHHLLRTTWFGTNSVELVGMSLEHLPTWLAVLYTAVSDKSFRKSKITEIAEKVGRGNLIRNFIDLVNIAVAKEYI